MVAKISVGSSLYGALSYNGEKINEGKGKLLLSNKVFDNGTGEVDIERALADFGDFMPSTLRTQKPIIHISLNPHPDDKLTDTELTEIAAKYMEQLGYGEQPYIIFKHEDIGREHLHIVSLRVGKDGKLLDNDFLYRKSKRITNDLEKKYGLLSSNNIKGNPHTELKKVDISQGDIKQQIGSVLRHATGNYRFQTMGEYRALLSLYNVTVEEPRGVAQGKEYHGLIYSATNDKGEKEGKPIKASQFGKYAGHKSMTRHFVTSKENIAKYKLHSRTANAITKVMRQTHNQDKLVAELKKVGIDAIFRETDAGRIYGATFIDHNTGCVLNGSRMGKELSANALEEHFNNAPRSTTTTYQQPSDNHEEQLSHQDDNSETDGVGLFSGASGGDDPEEERFRHAMQRKKRKKGRKLF